MTCTDGAVAASAGTPVPEAVARLIRECWAHDPASRPSFERLANDLRALVQHSGCSSSPLGTGAADFPSSLYCFLLQ